jgi:hypothetical protein
MIILTETDVFKAFIVFVIIATLVIAYILTKLANKRG